MSDEPTSLQPDSILDEARTRTDGLDDLGEGHFRAGLERFADSLEAEGRLNAVGRMIARERALLHTVNRLLYVRDRKLHPEIAKQEVVRPIFIVGMPRTGSTMLHDVLAQDPANRAPMTWETMFPSPPPETESFESDPRIELCEATFAPVDAAIPGFKAMHPMGARLSQECVTLMGETMITPLFHNQFRVPAYQDWVDREADWSEVYAFHERQLQHLGSRHMKDRWVLKTGAHMWGLEHLLATYPDARVVFTHRDPVKTMTSYASLTALVRSMGSDEVDRVEIAADWTERIRSVLEHALAVRADHPATGARFYDVHFSDFVRNQWGVVEQIYRAFDLPMSEAGARAMRAFIDDNPQGKHGVHRYSPEEYGVDPDAVRDAFRGYIDRFDLAPEDD